MNDATKETVRGFGMDYIAPCPFKRTKLVFALAVITGQLVDERTAFSKTGKYFDSLP